MQLLVVTRKSYHGYDAQVPSLGECETWGATEDDALAGLMERVAYFLSLPAGFKHTLNLSGKENAEKTYTLTLP